MQLFIYISTPSEDFHLIYICWNVDVATFYATICHQEAIVARRNLTILIFFKAGVIMSSDAPESQI